MRLGRRGDRDTMVGMRGRSRGLAKASEKGIFPIIPRSQGGRKVTGGGLTHQESRGIGGG